MKALVTGANGFIGSHLTAELVRKGYQVYCLVRKTSNLKSIEHLNVNVVYGDSGDQASLAKAVKAIDHVFHTAAIITALDWETHYRVNVLGTRNLIDACLQNNPRIKKFIHISSIGAMGPSGRGRFLNEESENHPVSYYGQSKLLAEEIVIKKSHLIPTVIIRPPNVIGPRQKELWDAIQLIKKRVVPVVGNGEKQTSLCYIDDLVRGILLAAQNDKANGQTYIISDPLPYAWNEITQAILDELQIGSLRINVPFALQYPIALFSELSAKILKKNPKLTRENLRATRDYYWLYSGSKIERELGFHTQISLRDGITRTIEFYRRYHFL